MSRDVHATVTVERYQFVRLARCLASLLIFVISSPALAQSGYG